MRGDNNQQEGIARRDWLRLALNKLAEHLSNLPDEGNVIFSLRVNRFRTQSSSTWSPRRPQQVAREHCLKDIYTAICKAFLRIQRNGVILFAAKLTPEALAELEAIEVAADEREAPPPPAPRKSQAELLEEQVREDWKTLATDKLKAKMVRDPQYKKVFDRLMAANQLESVATSYTDGSAKFHQ